MITRELNRFDDRLKAKDEGSTRLVYTLSKFVYYETIHREVIEDVYMSVGVMKD